MDERDYATGLNLFDRALSLSSSNIFALCCGALILSLMGKTDAAIERAQRALRFSPFDPLNYLLTTRSLCRIFAAAAMRTRMTLADNRSNSILALACVTLFSLLRWLSSVGLTKPKRRLSAS